MAETYDKTETRQASAPRFQPPPAETTGRGTQGASSLLPSSDSTKQWWWEELWEENREVFKELVKHILMFGMFLGSLELFHYLLKYSSISERQKLILDTVDFYMVVIILAIFGVRFIFKALKH